MHKIFRGVGEGFKTENRGTNTGDAKVIQFITAARELSPLMTTICLEGSCYPFHVLLKTVFPAARPYYNNEMHVVSLIGDRYYDITGEVHPKRPVLMTEADKKTQSKFVADLMIRGIKRG